MFLFLILAALALIGWLALTWWNQPDHVTFKAVIQNALRDVRDVLKLDAAVHWLVTNATALAVFVSGLVSMADPTLRQAILDATWHGVPVGAVGLLAVTWLATVKPTTYTSGFHGNAQ